jgi:tripeptide aminopeptidase
VGVIHGGFATNVVTDRVEIRAEARGHDPKFRAQIVREIEQAFERAAKELKNDAGATGSVEIKGRLDYESFKIERSDPSAQAAAAAIGAEGMEPEYAIANGGLDANWLTANGVPTVTLGCGQHAIHTVDEYIEIDEFAAACRVALRLATATDS